MADSAGSWTLDEDEKLRRSVAEQDLSKQINWYKVAATIANRNNKDCRKRWVYSLAPSIHKGPWDAEEDRLLREGVQIHGTKWAQVSRLIVTRNPDQSSRRWHEILKPNINRDRWSLLEDETLR
ncbi:hypothetical protein OCU04_004161 [Sclerotinia nivalis]|uniref:Uncharacterized protein n=1 Tax=Sclerotinia nivalis TaxID=352851 RepID=A0A9X0AQU8_9HELO|nr:hypothetical protein OCU04_004161 [Sclerotinia nivalis]